MRRLLAAIALALALTGCSDDVSPPGKSDIDVDTPELRELKADAGIEPCEPGAGTSDLPALTLSCLGGGSDVDLSTLTGPLLINIWNSPCRPCRKEMPVLQAFHEKYGAQVGVLGINVADTYPGAAIDLADATGATYPQLADPDGAIYDQDDVTIRAGVPQFVVLDAEGQVAGQAAGGLDSLDEVVALVEDDLGITL